MRVTIKTIAHHDQRYPTCGDWWWDRQGLQIRVSETGNWRYDMAIAFHEMMEALLCRAHGVSQARVDRFDRGTVGMALEDPGDDPRAPYVKEHTAGYVAEYAFLAGCGVAVRDYREALDRLYKDGSYNECMVDD